MSISPNLALPYLLAGQAQKEVTHNDALNDLDALAQITVIDRDLTAPPGSPTDGDCYLVPAGASGAWAGQVDKIAIFYAGWRFKAPEEGWILYVRDEDLILAYNGSAWARLGDGVLGLTANGFVVRTGAGNYVNRAVGGTANEVTVTNGDGVSAAPVVSLPAALTFTGKTVTGGIFAAEDGSVSNVAFGYSGAVNLGFYRVGTSLRLSASGTNMMDANSTRLTLGGTAGSESLRVVRVTSAVNYLTARGSVTTAQPSVTAEGSDTNIGIALTAKGTGEITFFQSGLRTFTVRDASGAAANSIIIDNGSAGNAPSLGVLGETNVDLRLNTAGTGVLRVGYATVAATTPANFTADRRLTIKDSSGTLYYIPCRASTW